MMEDTLIKENIASDLDFREAIKPLKKGPCPICGNEIIEMRAGLEVCAICDEVLGGGV